MRLTPAHTREAKDIAKALKAAMDELGISRDCRNPGYVSITLQQAQECLAKALGYEAGWKELLIELERPHKPVYFDQMNQSEFNREFEKIVDKLSKLLGFNYSHGSVHSAIMMAGVGYSPKIRRELAERNTPWGVINEKEEIAQGISSVSTSGHGGYILSSERQLAMPAHLRLSDAYYEEDTDWALMVLAFPLEFKEELKNALAAVGVFSSNSVPRSRNNVPSEHEKYLSEVMINYVPPDQDLMNRDVTAEEMEVILFLAECVLTNRAPVTVPQNHYPSLQDWVSKLHKSPRFNGKWAKQNAQWKLHWGQWEREEDENNERQREFDRCLDIRPPDNFN